VGCKGNERRRGRLTLSSTSRQIDGSIVKLDSSRHGAVVVQTEDALSDSVKA
jgi:hypothetical protein